MSARRSLPLDRTVRVVTSSPREHLGGEDIVEDLVASAIGASENPPFGELIQYWSELLDRR